MKLTNRICRRVCCFLCALAVAGCGSERAPGDRAETVVRDSAGWTIVSHPGPALEQAARAQLSEPDFDVGSAVRAGPAYEFTSVLAAFRLADDRVVVVDRGASEVRYFAADGTHLRSVGGEGDGPGEYRGILSATRLGADTIAVWDHTNQRITLLDGSGSMAGEIPVGATARSLTILTRLAGGAWAASARDLWYFETADLPQSSIRDSLAYVRVEGDGDSASTVRALPNFVLDVRPRTLAGRTQRVPFPRPFSPQAFIDGAAGRVVAGHSARAEWFTLEPGRTLARLELDERTVTDAHLRATQDAMRRSLAGRAPDVIERELTALSETPPMEELPAFDRLVAGRDSSVWMRRFVAPDETTARWFVFRPDGRLDATLELDAGSELLEATLDRVLLLARDALDVQSVVGRRLLRPVAASRATSGTSGINPADS